MKKYFQVISIVTIISFGLLTSPTAFAEMTVSSKRVSMSGKAKEATLNDLKKWSEGAGLSMHAMCAEVIEIPQSYICFFKSIVDMNNSLLRIGFFTGTADGYPKGTLISNNNSAVETYKNKIGGHTLTNDDISAFRIAANAATDSNLKFNPYESDFYSNIVDKISSSNSDSRYVVIAFANESSDSIVGHEINHASFYLQPIYKRKVLDFWQKNVSADDKSEIRSILGKLYNAKDDNIIIDEFQAYLTQSDEQKNPLIKFIPKYKRNFMKILKS